jgi:hypothetical protein
MRGQKTGRWGDTETDLEKLSASSSTPFQCPPPPPPCVTPSLAFMDAEIIVNFREKLGGTIGIVNNLSYQSSIDSEML